MGPLRRLPTVLQALALSLAALHPASLTTRHTHTGRPWTNEITLF